MYQMRNERLRWEMNMLPSDDLCRENAVMLKRFTRYPLIIDPSGQAFEFLYREYREKNIVQYKVRLSRVGNYGSTFFRTRTPTPNPQLPSRETILLFYLL